MNLLSEIQCLSLANLHYSVRVKLTQKVEVLKRVRLVLGFSASSSTL